MSVLEAPLFLEAPPSSRCDSPVCPPCFCSAGSQGLFQSGRTTAPVTCFSELSWLPRGGCRPETCVSRNLSASERSAVVLSSLPAPTTLSLQRSGSGSSACSTATGIVALASSSKVFLALAFVPSILSTLLL